MKLKLAKKIKLIRQKHNGCFIASFAMMFGLSYEDAVQIIHKNKIRQPYGYSGDGIQFNEAIERLRSLNLLVKVKPVKKIRKPKKNALICFSWKEDPSLSHTVLYDSRKKLYWDPSINEQYSSFKKLSRSYLDTVDAITEIHIK
jgi:hypothetical protein